MLNYYYTSFKNQEKVDFIVIGSLNCQPQFALQDSIISSTSFS